MRRLLLIALSCIALSISACRRLPGDTPQSGEEQGQEEAAGNNGSIKSGESSGDKIDACSQITKAEVEAALGTTVMEPTRGNELVSRKEGSLTSSCMFGSDEGFVSLDIKQQNPASTIAWNASRSYEELKDLIVKRGGEQASTRLEEVTGIGAAAFAQTHEETKDHQTTNLRILTTRVILTIRVSAPATTPTLEAAKIVAGKVTPRLQRYGSDAIVAAPQPAPQSDDDERRKSSKGSQTEDKSAKKAERQSARKAAGVASAKGGKGVSRRAQEPDSKLSRKSPKRSAERSKKETRKTTRPSPKIRRRS